MKSFAPQTLSQLFKQLTWEVAFYSVVVIIPCVAAILTIAFLNAERGKLHALTEQLAAVIKPNIQIGDEIEIRGLLSKTLETTDVLSLSVSGDQIQTLEVSRPGIESNLSEASYLGVLFSPYIVQGSTFKTYPKSAQSFSIKVAFPNTLRSKVFIYTALTSLLIGLLLFGVLMVRLRRAMGRIIYPLESLKHYIDSFDNPLAEKTRNEVDVLLETQSIFEQFNLLQARLEKQGAELLNKSVEEERGRLADQLGHDLKSHTSVLLRSIQSLRSKISEEDLLILHRTANDITIKMQKLQRVGLQSLTEEKRRFPLQLAPCVAHITQMKCIEYGHLDRLKIEFNFIESDHDVFCKIDPVELNTAISNLINNSVEAIDGTGEISLSVRREGELAVVLIRDNGCGIPKTLIDQVKGYGFSTKPGGNRGKGLSNAIEIVQRDQGELSIESEENKGTTIRLAYLSQEPRRSFVDSINLVGVTRVIIVENDHDFARRIEQILKNKNPLLHLLTLSDAKSFEEWASETISSTALVLMDYDLGDPQKNGLELIEKFKLQQNAILLTHNDSNPRILDACDHADVKLLPKILLNTVEFSNAASKKFKDYDGVVIEDDDLEIFHLRKRAKQEGINVLFYRSVSDFLKDSARLNKLTPIIMDSKLGEGEKGEAHAKKLFDELGFKRIVLNTNYDRDHFEKIYPDGMYWIEQIVPKDLEKVMACLEREVTVEI